MPKQIIQFNNVSKSYVIGELSIDALSDISFSIDEGQLVMVVGASGAGKTTILNLLGGMDRVSSGQILVEDQDITHYNERKLTDFRRDKVGFVFQFYNLIGNLTALENVEFASDVCKDALDPREVMDKVGLSQRLANFPSQLSGGEQQRVAIARAVAKNPLLLLCDEPTGALDYATSKQVLALLSEVNTHYRKTVVIITHNNQIASMGDKIIRVKSGQIQEVIQNPHKTPVEDLDW